MKISQIFILLFVGTAVGCAIWFGFFSDVHDFNRKTSQEERRSEAVGEKVIPRAPPKIVLLNRQRECRVIDSASQDGGQFVVYYHNACGTPTNADTIHWTGFAADGTVIMSDWNFTHEDLGPNQRGEFIWPSYSHLGEDPRVTRWEVKARYNDTY